MHWKSMSHIDYIQLPIEVQQLAQRVRKSEFRHRHMLIMTNINPKKEKITAIEILSG